MARDVMSAVCPDHEYLGIAKLDGYRISFSRRSIRTGTGVADIVSDPSSHVWGALYRLSDADVSSLDRKEGHGWAYKRQAIVVQLEGVPREAFTYTVVTKEVTEVQPSPAYLETLLNAARSRGLPDEYVGLLESQANASAG